MITRGDIVNVSINNAQITISHRAKVLYLPCAPGDSWGFENMDNGDEIVISEGCTIIKKKESPDEKAKG